MKTKKINIYKDTNNSFSVASLQIILSCVMLYSFCAIALFLPFFNIGFAFVIFCVLSCGLKHNAIKSVQGEKVKIEDIFIFYKQTITLVTLKMCKLFIVGVCTLFFIVPGIICAVNYSMSSYVFANDSKCNILDAMSKSKEIVKNYRWEVFILMALKYLFLLCTITISCTFVIFINIFVSLPNFVNIAIPCIFTTFVALFAIVPYFELCLANIYCNIKKLAEKEAKKAKQSENAE